MAGRVSEGDVEDSVLDYFRDLGYAYIPGPDLAPDGPHPDRRSGFDQVVLEAPLRRALKVLNPKLPAEALDDVVRDAVHPDAPGLLLNNQLFHRFLRDGVDVEYRGKDGRIVGDKAWLFDFDRPERNEWLVVNQLTVKDGVHVRRPDVLVYVNGFPLALFELKNPGDENATVKGAFQQLQTYMHQVGALFHANQILVASDGTFARHGTISSPWERFSPWRTIDGRAIAPKGELELKVLVQGMFEPARFLDLVRNFVLFEADDVSGTVVKKMAAYHQYHAVNAAVDATHRAASPSGDHRVGVVWHTQGSGKSISMLFYAAKVGRHPGMENPTLVVLTDRNDLDGQLFGTFAHAQGLIPPPKQAGSRAELKDLLKVASGGIVFTTIQKFLAEGKKEERQAFPLLSDRRNIVVIADEAHRSQYDFIDGFAKNIRDALPNASFIGFTGTPIEATDRSTPAVFGDYIDVYDIARAVEDGATVRIYYESRLAKLVLKEEERPRIDPDFEEVTEGEEEDVKKRMRSKWARLEAMVGAEKRVELVARDIVEHFERRNETLKGKAMVVAMSRRICVDLYAAIVKLRPQWDHKDDDKGAIKVVMTGSATDPLPYQQHLRNKKRNDAIAARLKDPSDPLQLVIVRDMWLTGFDAPVLHTMYLDKPMKGHTLMQAIARVNRVFRDKPGGLVVDYLGIADQLRRALNDYTEGSRDQAGIPIEQALAALREKHHVVATMFHGLDYKRFFTGDHHDRMRLLNDGANHVLRNPEEKGRFLAASNDLRNAFALAVPHPEALALRDEVAYFQAVRSNILKHTVTEGGKDQDDLDSAIRQIVSRAIASDEVIDIFEAAGLKKPDLSILSEEFLAELRGMKHKNLQLELLRKLLTDEIKVQSRKNAVQARSFREMLEHTMQLYQNRAIEAAQVIEELVRMAKEMKAARERGEQFDMSEEEVAFYDALAANASAKEVLGDENLRLIARELVETIRKTVDIDWTLKESVRARMRAAVRRLLRKHGYPPDMTEGATQTVLEQAELLCKDWTQGESAVTA